jgi:hypothetical protein
MLLSLEVSSGTLMIKMHRMLHTLAVHNRPTALLMSLLSNSGALMLSLIIQEFS